MPEGSIRASRNLGVFLWPMGQGHLWKMSDGPPYFILYGEDSWPTGDKEADMMYAPLGVSKLHQAFEDLGRRAVEKSDSTKSAGWEWIQRDGAKTSYVHGNLGAVANAERDASVRKAVMRFLRDFGAPAYYNVVQPLGLAVQEVLIDAYLMYDAANLDRDIKENRKLGRDVRADEARMATLLHQYLAGVSLNPLPGQLSYTCDTLLSAMWLQLAEWHYGGGAWAVCRGCGRLFTPGRVDQTYHNAACRNRAGVNKSRARSPGQTQG